MTYIDPPLDMRCAWEIALKDGSKAQCGRKHTDGQLCTQHQKMRRLFNCEYCGGNDENPPEHCQDCEKPE